MQPLLFIISLSTFSLKVIEIAHMIFSNFLLFWWNQKWFLLKTKNRKLVSSLTEIIHQSDVFFSVMIQVKELRMVMYFKIIFFMCCNPFSFNIYWIIHIQVYEPCSDVTHECLCVYKILIFVCTSDVQWFESRVVSKLQMPSKFLR